MPFTTSTTRGKQVLGLAVVLLMVALGLIVSFLGNGKRGEGQGQPALEVRLGLPLQPSSALLIVALEKGLFRQNGLTVTVHEYPSGKRALQEGLFSGAVEVAGSSDFPVSIAGMLRQDFRIIASTFSADDVNSIIARRDAGIAQAGDLKGKRIATQHGSAVHYFLHLFLLEHGLSEEDVQLTFMKAEELPEALTQGRIDAFSMRSPYIGQAKEMLGKNAVIFSAPGLHDQQELLLVREDALRANPQLGRRLLKALQEAELYSRAHPDEVMPLVAARLHAEPAALAPLEAGFLPRLALDQSLLVRLEDEGRWAMRARLVDADQIPNYLEIIQVSDLQELRPEAVTIH